MRPRAAFDGRLALQHESELDEELCGGCEVVNHDADVLHPLDSHVFAPGVLRIDVMPVLLGSGLRVSSCTGLQETGTRTSLRFRIWGR